MYVYICIHITRNASIYMMYIRREHVDTNAYIHAYIYVMYIRTNLVNANAYIHTYIHTYTICTYVWSMFIQKQAS